MRLDDNLGNHCLIASYDRTTVPYWTTRDIGGLVPPELGDLARLTTLSLHTNSLSGTIPESLLQLKRLERLVVRNNSLCVPRTSAFTAWLAGLDYEDTGDFEACDASAAAAGNG